MEMHREIKADGQPIRLKTEMGIPFFPSPFSPKSQPNFRTICGTDPKPMGDPVRESRRRRRTKQRRRKKIFVLEILGGMGRMSEGRVMEVEIRVHKG